MEEEMETVTSPITKCVGCESDIDNEGDGGRWSEIKGGEFCWNCFQSDIEHASTITYLVNGEKQRRVVVAANWIVDGEYYEDLTAKETEGINHYYTRTDGWRGYWTTTLGDDWVEVAEGMFLWGEDTDIVTMGGTLQELHKEGVLPCEVALVADLTSNVFAAGCSIFVRKADLDVWNSQKEEIK
jgi:hypothetical protein